MARPSIVAALEWFIPPNLRENPDTYRRAQMFIGAHLFGTPLGHVIALYLFMIESGPRAHLWLLTGLLAIFYPFPFLLRWTSKFATLSILSMQNLSIIVLSTAFNYGGVGSPFLIWVPVIPLLAYFYLGARPAMRILVSALLAANLAAFYSLHSIFGLSFPEYVPVEMLGEVGFLSIVVAVAFVSIMAIYYEHVAKQATEIRAAHIRADNERERAEAANRAKSDFLARISHELRTPMNAVLGFAQLLEINTKDPLTAPQARQVGLIRKSGKHLLALIDEILDLSKIEAGSIGLSIERVPLGGVFEQVRATIQPLAEAAEVNFVINLAPDVPPVRADQMRLIQVLINLGTNAIKYNRARGRVTLNGELFEPGWVRLSMIDTGIGIPKPRQAEIFQPFNRLGAERGTVQGTGIGLAIAHRLVQLMNGRLQFQSVEGQGSTFTVDLPVAPPELVKTSRGKTDSPAAGQTSILSDRDGAKHTVLYIEDNPSNIALMQELVDSLPNIRLFTATDAGIGIALARAKRPNLIVLDINLPGANGFEALRELKRTASTANIPVMALTAAAAPHDVERGKAEGFAFYLTKPLDVRQFLGAVEALLSDRQG